MPAVVVGIIVLVLIIVAVIFMITTYNSLVKLRNSVRNSFAQVDTQLQRRFDLIPNLVETVKGFAHHEKELFESVAASRSGYMNASSNAEKMAMNGQLTSALNRLFVVAESYPELKANSAFANLQEELEETEDKIAFSRQFYNDAVTIYNNKIQMFPNNVVAGMFGFREEELFNAVDDASEAPQVKF